MLQALVQQSFFNRLVVKATPGWDGFFLILWCLIIYALSDRSTLPLPPLFPHADKLIHAGAYGLMGMLAWRACLHLNTATAIRLFLSVAFCSFYGISDEWHQSFVPGRDSDWADWLADTTGAVIAVITLHYLNELFDAQAQR